MGDDHRIHLKLDDYGRASLEAYLEYRKIVGDDTLMTPAEYEAYKAKVLPLRRANRLYVSWGPLDASVDCKLIGPENMCFCGHRYRLHQTDFEKVERGRDLELTCKQRGCQCRTFTHVPRVSGSLPVKCSDCHHSPLEHRPNAPFGCARAACECTQFRSFYKCECGAFAKDHQTLVETRSERQARGQPVNNLGHSGEEYAALGGITHFSSLAWGHERAQFQVAESAITSAAAVVPAQRGSSRPMTEAEEMAFYEKRYQDRLKAEKEARRTGGKVVAVNFANGIPLAMQSLLDEPDEVTLARMAARQPHARPPAAAARTRSAVPETRAIAAATSSASSVSSMTKPATMTSKRPLATSASASAGASASASRTSTATTSAGVAAVATAATATTSAAKATTATPMKSAGAPSSSRPSSARTRVAQTTEPSKSSTAATLRSQRIQKPPASAPTPHGTSVRGLDRESSELLESGDLFDWKPAQIPALSSRLAPKDYGARQRSENLEPLGSRAKGPRKPEWRDDF